MTCSEPEVDIGPNIRLQTDEQAALLREIARHYPEFDWSETPKSEQRFYLGNKFFEIGDAVILYALLRRFRPKRIIEVRSGFSSALMMDSNDRFLGGSMRFTFIEPYSERLRSLLTDQDKGRIDLLETVVQNVPWHFQPSSFQKITTMHLSTLDSRAPASGLMPELSPDRPLPAVAEIAIVGLGYVGLPLSLQFARSGVNVLGLDVDPEKVNALNEGRSYIKHVPAETVAEEVKANRLEATTDFARVDEVQAVIICVPTPLSKNREPDISYILETGRAIAQYIRKGTLVVLESTTYPGTTTTRTCERSLRQDRDSRLVKISIWLSRRNAKTLQILTAKWVKCLNSSAA